MVFNLQLTLIKAEMNPAEISRILPILDKYLPATRCLTLPLGAFFNR